MKWSAWVPVFAYLAVIFTLTSVPTPPPIPGVPAHADKGWHLLAYLALGALLFRAVLLQWPQAGAKAAARKAIGWGLVYGLLDELHQIPIPGRGCSGWDLLADAIGIFAGALVAMALARRVSREDEPLDGS